MGAILVVVAALYGRSLRFPFIGFDDTQLIVDNQAFLSDPAHVVQAFRQHAWTSPTADGAGAYYRPLFVLSLMWDAQWGGAHPLGYHVTNLLLHALAAFLACLLFVRLGVEPTIAFFLGMVVAVHPALAEVVAWVPGRNESLLCAFVTASMLALDRHARRRDWRSLFLHLVLSLAALFTKEHAVALVLAAPAFLWLVRGQRPGGHARLWIGWTLILCVWLLARHHALRAPLPVAPADLLANVWTNLVVPIHYAGKALLPVALAIMPTAADTPIWPGLLAVTLLATLALSSRRRVALWGCLWFLAFVAPTLVVPVLVGQEVRLYTPLLGLLAAIAPPAAGAVRRWPRASRLSCLAILLAFAAVTWRRVPSFSNRERFWQSAVEASSHSSLALMNLASIDLEHDRPAQSESLSRRALAINPTEPKAHNNLAIALARQGRNAEAEAEFRRETELNPGYADAYLNLGTLLASTGRTDEAADLWRRALERNPQHRRALAALARYHLRRNETQIAQPYLERLKALGVPARNDK
jgi:protein O-mannosyl-transferase